MALCVIVSSSHPQLVIFECKENPQCMGKLDISEVNISRPKCSWKIKEKSLGQVLN